MRTLKCERERPRRNRTTLSITIDHHVLSALKKWMEKEGEQNTSAVIEGFIYCGIRDTCDGCPNYDDLSQDEKDGISGKLKVGKWEENERNKK